MSCVILGGTIMEWVTPDFVEISLSCECTAYAGARQL